MEQQSVAAAVVVVAVVEVVPCGMNHKEMYCIDHSALALLSSTVLQHSVSKLESILYMLYVNKLC